MGGHAFEPACPIALRGALLVVLVDHHQIVLLYELLILAHRVGYQHDLAEH